MLIARIEGATRVLGAPADMDDCGALAIRDDTFAGGEPCMVSAWEPTPDELARLNAGAKVHLYVIGRGHPPVYVGVGNVA